MNVCRTDDRSQLFVVWLVCLLALLVRYAAFPLAPVVFHAVEDYRIAQHLVAGDGYVHVLASGVTAMKVPVYPLFLATMMRLFGSGHAFAIIIAHQVLAAAVPLMLWGIGREIGRPNVGLGAGILFALHPTYVYYPVIVEVTNLFVPLAVACCWLLCRWWREPTVFRSVMLGLGAALLILTQAVSIVPLFGAVMWLGRKRWRYLAVWGGALLVVMAPWVWRNYQEFGVVIPTKSPFWMNVVLGYDVTLHQHPAYDAAAPAEEAQLDAHRWANDVLLEPYYKAVALAKIRHDPLLYLHKTVHQALWFWTWPPRYQSDGGWGVWLARKLPVVLLLALSLPGMVLLGRSFPGLAVAVMATFAYFTAVYAFTAAVNVRYKLDVEWLQLFPAAMSLSWLAARLPWHPGGGQGALERRGDV